MSSVESSVSAVVALPKPLLTSAVSALLDGDDRVDVVAQSDGPGEALRYVRGHKPDIVLFGPDGESHLQLLNGLGEVSPSSYLLALLPEASARQARDLMLSGTHGVLSLDESEDSLFSALLAVARGDGYVNPRMAVEVANLKDGPPGGLSNREIEILSLVALGYTNQQVADELFLSIRTVESHRASILAKLGFDSRREMVRYALEQDLIKLPPVA